MRASLLALAAMGCGVPRPSDVAPAATPANAVDPAELAMRLSGLRATLARNHAELDTAPVIDTCNGDHYHDGGERRCMRCELASVDNTAGIDLGLIDGVAIAFALYPPSLFEAAQVEHVALCRTIRLGGGEMAPAGIAIAEQHRVLISVEQFAEDAPVYRDFSIEQVVHHEVFHLFDRATSGERVYDDREWNALNPSGFAYHDPAGDARLPGFVNQYATTNELEDRASVFEYLLGQPDRLCELAHADPVIAAKTAAVWRRVAKVVGDPLLRRHAPCVDWIGARPKKAPKPKPRRKGPVDLRYAPRE